MTQREETLQKIRYAEEFHPEKVRTYEGYLKEYDTTETDAGTFYYTKKNFPHFVCNHGNWDIYANAAGTLTAAIPTPEAAADGCKASNFGTLEHVRKNIDALEIAQLFKV